MTASNPRPLLEGKVVVVIGASRGIGAAIAAAYAATGARVVIAARDLGRLHRVAETITATGADAHPVKCDVTNDGDVAHLIRHVVDHFGALDIACNNAAGGGHPPTPLAEVTPEQFDSAYRVNLRGVFIAMHHEITAMLANEHGGAIVNISSTAGHQGVAGLAAYVTTKHGLEGLSKVAALDYADRNIRVNVIAPGPILTDNLANAGERAQQGAAAAIPMRRIGQPDEVAAAAVWLSSDAASFITGTSLLVDGGRLAGTAAFNTRLQPVGNDHSEQ